MTKLRTLIALGSVTLAAGFAPALALATPPKDTGKCNSGNGNLSETTPATDCDPGNSAGHNNGGD